MSLPRLLLAGWLALLPLGPVSRTAEVDAYPRQSGIDVVDYRFDLRLFDTTDVVVCQASILVRIVEEGVREIALDLVGRTDQTGKGMTVEQVKVDDSSAAFEHRADRLVVRVPSKPASSSIRITVKYRGIPATGLIIGPNKYGDRTFFSDNWPNKARNWLPTIDHPYDKATSEFAVVAPDRYQVISNGRLIETTDLGDGTRLTRWRQSVPIATWLYCIGVAPFAVERTGELHGKPIETWVFRQDRDAGFSDFREPTRDVLAFFDAQVGPYSYEKLANVQSNSVAGGMEAATAIFYDPRSVTGHRDVRWRNVVIHEIAHQWFGNAVTESDWNDVWLSEGFATYFTLLFIEHAYGRDEFVRGLAESRTQVLDFNHREPDYRVVHENLVDMARVTTGMTYQKGAWTLHMLRHELGDATFWAGIRSYYAQYRDQNASTAQFRAAMEQASGRDLRKFFDQWLYRGGIPQVTGTWQYDRARRTIEVTLVQQEVPGGQFAMPLEIGISDSTRKRRVERVELGPGTRTYTFGAEAEPDAVALDPDTWALFEGTLTRRGVSRR